MKYIIALSGKSNCGKSTTINKVISLCEKRFNTIFVNRKCLDWFGMFEYKGIMIGIAAKGDKEELILDELRKIEDSAKKKCDIFVCACHIYGETVDCIHGLAIKYKAQIIMIHKGDYIESPHDIKKKRDAFNTIHAKMILDEIIECCK